MALCFNVRDELIHLDAERAVSVRNLQSASDGQFFLQPSSHQRP